MKFIHECYCEKCNILFWMFADLENEIFNIYCPCCQSDDIERDNVFIYIDFEKKIGE